MVPIVAVVGVSDSGKTTLLEKLVAELKSRGYKVGTVKHDVHGFDVDREGKDSWRHKKAGAHSTVVSSPTKLFLVRDEEFDLPLVEVAEELLHHVDVVVAEGYKRSPGPKIEVHRKEQNRELLCRPEEGVLAVASDEPLDTPVPVLDINDARGLASIIEERVIKKRKPGVALWVNGRRIPLNPFVQDFIIGTVSGMAGALDGVDRDDVQTLELKLN